MPSRTRTGVLAKRCTTSRRRRWPSNRPRTPRPLSAPRSKARSFLAEGIAYPLDPGGLTPNRVVLFSTGVELDPSAKLHPAVATGLARRSKGVNRYQVYMTTACRQQWKNLLIELRRRGLEPEPAAEWLREFTTRLREGPPGDNQARIKKCEAYGTDARFE